MSAADTARLGLVIAVVDLKRRLWTLEDAGLNSISLNDVWALLKPIDASLKELQAAQSSCDSQPASREEIDAVKISDEEFAPMAARLHANMADLRAQGRGDSPPQSADDQTYE
jgi:hypothetical protein